MLVRVLIGMSLAIGTCASAEARHRAPVSVPAEANKALFRRYVDIWQSGRLDELNAIVGSHYVGHASSGDRDIAGLRERIAAFRSLFPDIRFTILDQLAEGDRVATRMVAVGTSHATGKRVTLVGLNISRFQQGRIVEEWPVWETVK